MWLPASLSLHGQRVLEQERYWDKVLGQVLSLSIEIREGRWFLAARGRCWGRGEARAGSSNSPWTCSTSCSQKRQTMRCPRGTALQMFYKQPLIMSSVGRCWHLSSRCTGKEAQMKNPSMCIERPRQDGPWALFRPDRCQESFS